jgi:hypothetical protein
MNLLKSTIFWSVTLWSLLEVHLLHFQGPSKLRNTPGRSNVIPRNVSNFHRTHGVTLQKMELFIVTAVRTSSPAQHSKHTVVTTSKHSPQNMCATWRRSYPHSKPRYEKKVWDELHVPAVLPHGSLIPADNFCD